MYDTNVQWINCLGLFLFCFLFFLFEKRKRKKISGLLTTDIVGCSRLLVSRDLVKYHI